MAIEPPFNVHCFQNKWQEHVASFISCCHENIPNHNPETLAVEGFYCETSVQEVLEA